MEISWDTFQETSTSNLRNPISVFILLRFGFKHPFLDALTKISVGMPELLNYRCILRTVSTCSIDVIVAADKDTIDVYGYIGYESYNLRIDQIDKPMIPKYNRAIVKATFSNSSCKLPTTVF